MCLSAGILAVSSSCCSWQSLVPNCMNCRSACSHFSVLQDKIHLNDKRASRFYAGERQKEELWQRASVKWTAGSSGWEQAELPIAICFHWWEHQWGCCHLCVACANQARGQRDLELGAVQLPVLPLATSLIPDILDKAGFVVKFI